MLDRFLRWLRNEGEAWESQVVPFFPDEEDGWTLDDVLEFYGVRGFLPQVVFEDPDDGQIKIIMSR
jgi:hypothetical protein